MKNEYSKDCYTCEYRFEFGDSVNYVCADYYYGTLITPEFTEKIKENGCPAYRLEFGLFCDRRSKKDDDRTE